MKPVLVIVQNRPTQFDVPLYAFLEKTALFDLHVFYTETHSDAGAAVDPETGLAPCWDHLQHCSYAYNFFSADEINTPARAVRKICLLHPELVIISGYSPLFHARLAWLLKRKKVRIGLRSDNTLRHSSFHGVKGIAKRCLLPEILRFYDCWHPVGTLARQYLEKMAGEIRPTFLFPYAVDNRWFADQAELSRPEQIRLRNSLSLARETFIVLGILKWHEREDPLTLVDAFVRLCTHLPGAFLILVGDGPLRPEVEQRLHSVQEQVLLPGYVPYSELPKFYGLADVFVHPAVGEPWGVSVNEAMACGVPVIVAEGVGAGYDLITEDVTGYVFPDRDSVALARKLQVCAQQCGKRADMKKAVQERIARWDYSRTLEEFQRAISQ